MKCVDSKKVLEAGLAIPKLSTLESLTINLSGKYKESAAELKNLLEDTISKCCVLKTLDLNLAQHFMDKDMRSISKVIAKNSSI